MFVSFFPRPKLFFPSSILWTALAMAIWYGFASNLFQAPEKPVGLATFWSAPALWFDLYFALTVAVFAAAWMLFAPHPWATWSILGSALILFTSYFQVQVSVAINSWYGPFYNLVQAALSKSAPVTTEQFYSELQQQSLQVRVGMEASGHSRWFERLLGELQFELWIGNAAEIRTKRVRRQKTDRQDAQLLLRLMMEDRFPRIWVPDSENRDL